MTTPPLKVLVLCTHNRCRSILFEAIARAEAGPGVEVRSAGSEPADEVHPATLEALTRAGIATEGLRSEGWDRYEAWDPEVVVTVCDRAAQEPCPLWLGKAHRLHWGLPDPSLLEGPEQSQAFTEVIEAIRARLPELSALAATPPRR
jgi:arsenate reductase (thioredoxin)